MGEEAVSSVRWADQASEGKALLETSEIIFRGDFRLRIPFNEIESLTDIDGELRIGFRGETAVFSLGRKAETWAAKIRNPRGRLDKLGVKMGARVAVIGVEDNAFKDELASRGVVLSDSGEPAGMDIVFYEADREEQLAHLAGLAKSIKQNGAIWVVSPKGKGALLKDTEVMAAARGAGLVDTKVVAFSDTHTALKLVIPVASRAKVSSSGCPS